MPRLVLWPTMPMVASTARRMRGPTEIIGMAIEGAATRALSSKSATLMSLVRRVAVNIARLQRVELGQARIMEGAGDFAG